MCYSKIKLLCLIHHHTMRKAAAKVQKYLQSDKEKAKIITTAANFSLFTHHFSLYFRTFAPR